MQSVLLSNIPHYHHLAEALHGAGMLKRYITASALIGEEQAPGWLPAGLRHKLEGRRLHHVPQSLTRQIRWPEILQRVLPKLRAISHERADWLNNELFDRLALPSIEGSGIFHFVSSVGLHCARKAKALGAIVVCDVRQEHPSFQKRILEEECSRFQMKPQITGTSYEARVLQEFALADYIVVPSQHARRTFLDEGFAAEKLLLLPYGVDVNHFRNSGKPDKRFRVIYAGSLTVRKGPQYLLEAFSQMDKTNSELILVGPLDPSFEKILARYEGSFRYLGVVPKLALKELYSSSSVFVLPSLADSFSLATLEAMACGVPVIVSENTGAADALDNGIQGFVVPIRNPVAIQEHLEFLRRDENARVAMGLSAALRAREWNWDRYGKEAVRHYKKIGLKTSQFVTV